MASFIIRRILWTIPVLLLATFITFVMVKALPYEPYNSPKLAPSVKANLRKLHGLDKAWYEQYGIYVSDLLHGDLGVSSKPGNTPVKEKISATLPTSALLGSLAFLFSAIVGTALGVVGATYANRWPDHLVTVVSTISFALPIFIVARYWVEATPYYGWDTWSHRMGPIIVLGWAIMPYFTRLVRASMIETLHADFVTAARAKGLPWRTTVVRHVLRNSLIPTVTNAGPLLGFMLTGSFIIEYIMIVPGIGSEFVDAFRGTPDTRMALNTTVLLSTIIIVLNLIVDIIVSWLDPRIARD